MPAYSPKLLVVLSKFDANPALNLIFITTVRNL